MEEERMGSDDATEEERSTEAEQNVEREHDDDEEQDGSPPPGFRPIQPLPPEHLVSPVELVIAEKERRVTCEVGTDDEDSQRLPQPAVAPPPILNVGKSMPFEKLPPPRSESVSRLRAQTQNQPEYQSPSPRTMAPLPMNNVGRMTLQSPPQVPHLTAPSYPPPGYQFPPPHEAPPGPVRESGTALPLQRPPPQPQNPATQPMMPRQPAVHHPQSRPPLPAPTYEMAQMVCGSCHQLLSYIRGARYVQCSCCQTVNYVLEEHQVGQVKCSSCSLLLMYPYGAPSVKCSSCYSVTEIGEHNKRPPWSVQQGRAPPPCNTVR